MFKNKFVGLLWSPAGSRRVAWGIYETRLLWVVMILGVVVHVFFNTRVNTYKYMFRGPAFERIYP